MYSNNKVKNKFRKKENVELLCINAAMQEVCVSWTTYGSKELIKRDVYTYYKSDHIQRSEKLVPSIEYVRNLAHGSFDNLSCIGLVVGPGSFTGLRNSLSFAKGITAVKNIPIVGISTHDCIAFKHGVFKKTPNTKFEPLLVANDARGKKYYSALYLEKLSLSATEAQTDVLSFGKHGMIYDTSLAQLNTLIKQKIPATHTIRCAGGNTIQELQNTIHQLKHIDNTHNYTISTSHMTSHEALRDFSMYCYVNNSCTLLCDAQPLYIRNSM